MKSVKTFTTWSRGTLNLSHRKPPPGGAGVEHVPSLILVNREQLLELEDRRGETLREEIRTEPIQR